ncbi:MAG: hypothetical protein R6U31_05885 [bacterium]
MKFINLNKNKSPFRENIYCIGDGKRIMENMNTRMSRTDSKRRG